MTGLTYTARSVLHCVWATCSISIVVAYWQLDELRHRCSNWRRATTRLFKLGAGRFASHLDSSLSRTAARLAGHADVFTRKEWLLILLLLTAALIISIAG